MIAKVEVWPIEKLKPWDKNPRAIKESRFEQLKGELAEKGQFKPLLVTSGGVVIGGNMRLEALKQLGISDVLVAIQEDVKTDKEIFDRAIRDNEEYGYYEQEQLAELALNIGFEPIELHTYEISLGKPTPLDDLINKFGPDPEEDEVPEAPELPVSNIGEIYQIGRHRVMCGDSTDFSQVTKLTENKLDYIAMIYTDPPYGLGGYGGRNNMDLEGDDEDVQKFYEAIPTTISERYIWGNFKNLNNVEEPRDVIIWVKNNFGLGIGYRGQYECCFYYGNFSGSDSDVWQQDKDSKYDHPTQKPVKLAGRAIKNSSKPGDSVLDLYLGSGSTLIACEQMDRICYGMEIDPQYVDVIRKRYWKLQNNGDETGWEEATPVIPD